MRSEGNRSSSLPNRVGCAGYCVRQYSSSAHCDFSCRLSMCVTSDNPHASTAAAAAAAAAQKQRKTNDEWIPRYNEQHRWRFQLEATSWRRYLERKGYKNSSKRKIWEGKRRKKRNRKMMIIFWAFFFFRFFFWWRSITAPVIGANTCERSDQKVDPSPSNRGAVGRSKIIRNK